VQRRRASGVQDYRLRLIPRREIRSRRTRSTGARYVSVSRLILCRGAGHARGLGNQDHAADKFDVGVPAGRRNDCACTTISTATGGPRYGQRRRARRLPTGRRQALPSRAVQEPRRRIRDTCVLATQSHDDQSGLPAGAGQSRPVGLSADRVLAGR
jgi:hypothetical protein